MDDDLNNDNFMLYCAKHYDGRYAATTEDFEQDVATVKYIKRLITLYQTEGELKTRLIMNHIITMNNVFGPEATVKILYLRIKQDFHCIKPFLVAISILPEKVRGVSGEAQIDMDEVPMDPKIVEELRKL